MATGLQKFSSAYPFDISFESQYQGEKLPILYIVDNENADNTITQICINITPSKDTTQFTLAGFPLNVVNNSTSNSDINGLSMLYPVNSLFVPNKYQFNLAFVFRPGVLKKSLITLLSKILQNALSNTFPTNEIVVSGPTIRVSDGSLIWHCALRDDEIIPAEGIQVLISGISASSGVGSRSTQVELLIGNVILNSSSPKLNFNRSVQVDIVNHQGKSSAPLFFGLLGQTKLINNQTNNFQLYFEWANKEPKFFGDNTEFSFKFSYGDETSNLMHFGEKDEVLSIKWDNSKGAVDPGNNFAGKYILNTTPASDLGNGTNLIELTATFTPDPNLDYENKEYTAINNQLVILNSDKKSSLSYYSQQNGPVQSAQQVIANYWNSLCAQRIVLVDKNFIDNYNKIPNPYLLSIFNNNDSNQSSGTQNVLGFVHNTNMLDPNNQNAIPDGIFSSIDCTQQFTTSNWDSAAQNMANYYIPNTKASTRFMQIFNTKINNNSNYNTNRWGDSQFVNFLEVNFNDLIQNLANQYSSGGFFCYQPNKVACSNMLYDYLYDVYVSYMQDLTNIVNAFASTFLINSNTNLNSNLWSQVISQAQTSFQNSNPPISTTILSQDSANVSLSISSRYNPSNAWFDEMFLRFTQNNLVKTLSDMSVGITNYNKLIVQVVNPVNTNNVQSYIVPSMALWDYFLACYQIDTYSDLLSVTPEKLHFYINPASCVFNFTDLKLSGLDGIAIIHISVRNLPGYWDTDFQVPIVKKSPYLPFTNATNAADLPTDMPIGSMIIQQGENGIFAQYPGDNTPHANVNGINTQQGTWVASSQFWSDTTGNWRRYTYVMFVKVSNNEPTSNPS
jgi:hypothetical protein